MKKRKVLVTGGAGFIGSAIVADQLNKGHEVWVVDSLVTGQKKNIEPYLDNPSFRFDEADVCFWAKLDEALVWADRIFHMAASVGQKFVLKHPVFTITNNVSSSQIILESMVKNCSKAFLLIASTSELYCHSKENKDGTVSETAEIGINYRAFQQETYPIAKLTNEIMGLSYVYEKGVKCTIARLFNSIGLNQSPAYGMVVPTFISQALNGSPLTVFGDGLQSRSFVDVRDTATALDLLMDHPESSGGVFNVGNDKECSILDLAHLIIKKTNSPSEITYIPYDKAYGLPFTDVRRRKPDLRKLKKLTGFEPKFSLEDSIDSIIDKMRTEKCRCG